MTNTPCPLNTYWITEGRFLAGEYPRDISIEKSVPKLRKLVESGVTFFVDLTEEGELDPYDQLLEEAGDGARLPLEYRRFPIRDVSTPEKAEQMTAILDTIDSALSDGHGVYVHCWGGIGRTGTVVGCWLSRHGDQGPAALEALETRWQHCEKSSIRESPETEAQRQFVREWSEEEMAGEEPLLEFEEEALTGEACFFADLPDKWHEGDFFAELDHYKVLEALHESADYVNEDAFEEGGPGMSGAYYKVYAQDKEAFRRKLTARLLTLLEDMEENDQ